MRRNLLSMLVMIVFAVFAAGTGDSSEDPPTRGSRSQSGAAHQAAAVALPMPPEQQAFCAAVKDAAEQYEAAKAGGENQLKLSKMKTTRSVALKKAVPNKAAKDWVGTVASLKTNSEGKASVTVTLPCGFHVKTWNNAVSDIGSNTLVPQNSPLYDALSNLSEGAALKFSGKFFPDAETGLRESSLSEAGGMTDPEFIIRFTEIGGI